MTGAAEQDRLAILVHEVRSPVAALAAIAEAYREADPPARRSLSALAVRACVGIERIVVDASVASVHPQDVDIRRIVDETVEAWVLTGGNVRAEVASGVGYVTADPQRIRQALDNLVVNALAHSPVGGDVIVGARSGSGHVLLTVVDFGPGIPPDEHERIFDAGVRLNAGSPGSGLGLAIARAIAIAHDGRLTVSSVVGEGATFTLALPQQNR